ncbi:hypothetical protein CIB93_13805 [Streptomyces sp. WZ.A104]|uniref:tyrosine-type recombinase/integrase n=1 Tax=Streptomyces sp. WZ.A104 TaxID=2023771 RepID=UPI000BBCEA04|nr:tyrosine-type recombinase/integrase [Streptomyces sp. WZ.A104]PCG85428.1 hypothetical protein CIB93_13805 [Streptomyces sp. WZ.A104]
MFEGSVYRRCKCRTPKLNDAGQPVTDSKGNTVVRELGASCPDLKKRDHGSWYYYLKLPDGPLGERRRPRKGGFSTAKEAKKAAQNLWDEDQSGIDIDSKETVAQYLRRWHTKRVDLKRTTHTDYRDYLERVFIPALGHLTMRELRARHIQAVFEAIWAENEVKEANREAAKNAEQACRAAHQAWKAAAKPRPPELRQAWHQAKAELKEARSKPRQDTGPGRQKKFLDALSSALKDAVGEKLITQNWCDSVTIPKYHKPDPLVWTPERTARWRQTGERPGPVMVWTPDQTGQFLDAAVDHPMYIMWHLMIFRAPRRGEASGLRWAEVDMTKGSANITEQLVTDSSYTMWEDAPKSRSGKRTITLDSATFALLAAWRDVQKEQRKEWEAKHREDPEKYGPYVDSGYVFTRPDGRPHNPNNVSQAFARLIKRLDLPPVRLHDLRHCAASLSLAAGLSMKAIQALLGHSSYSLTADTYTSLMPQFEQAAADAALDLVPRQKPSEGESDAESGGTDEGSAPTDADAAPEPAEPAPGTQGEHTGTAPRLRLVAAASPDVKEAA